MKLHFVLLNGTISTVEIPNECTTETLRKIALSTFGFVDNQKRITFIHELSTREIIQSNKICLCDYTIVDEDIINVTFTDPLFCPRWLGKETITKRIWLSDFLRSGISFVPHYRHSVLIYAKRHPTCLNVVAKTENGDETILYSFPEMLSLSLTIRNHLLFINISCYATREVYVCDITSPNVEEWNVKKWNIMTTIQKFVPFKDAISFDAQSYVCCQSQLINKIYVTVVEIYDTEEEKDNRCVTFTYNGVVTNIAVAKKFIVLITLEPQPLFELYTTHGVHLCTHFFTPKQRIDPTTCRVTLDRTEELLLLSDRDIVYRWKIYHTNGTSEMQIMQIIPEEPVVFHTFQEKKRCISYATEEPICLSDTDTVIVTALTKQNTIYELWSLRKKSCIGRFIQSDGNSPFYISPNMTQVMYIRVQSTTVQQVTLCQQES